MRCRYHRIFRSARTFSFLGESYHYFYHKYNTTWKNERAVEIAIIWPIVKQYAPQRILELGNVLSHYFPVNHDIVDKDEKASNVINQDIVDFRPAKQYNLIVSISTLEHVGWDKESVNILAAVENLIRCLAPRGKIVATLPLGYNPGLDRLLLEKKLPFTATYYLKRINAENSWVQTEWANIQNIKYNCPFYGANGLLIGIVQSET